MKQIFQSHSASDTIPAPTNQSEGAETQIPTDPHPALAPPMDLDGSDGDHTDWDDIDGEGDDDNTTDPILSHQ